MIVEDVEQWRSERRSKFPTKSVVGQKQEDLQRLVDMGGIVPDQSKTHKKRQERNAGDSSNICHFFSKFGKCKRGSNCRLLHQRQTTRADSLASAAQDTSTAVVHSSAILEPTSAQDLKTVGNDEVISNSCDSTSVRADAGVPTANDSAKKRKQDDRLRDKRPTKHGKVKDGLFLPDPFDGGERGTLLKNLLKSEITSEENILLQCVRFLVTKLGSAENVGRFEGETS
jgi:hypothetical protein